MTFVRSFSLASVVVLALSSVACGGSGGSDAASDPAVTMSGRIGGSSTTKTFTGLSATGSGNVHVIAHEVHKRGDKGRNVEVAVGSDGYFSVDLARGSRWMITVDDAGGGSAIVSFGGKSVVAAGKDGGHAQVDIGNLHVVGGEAQCDVTIDGRFDLQATLAEADEIIEDANGAVIEAQAAADEAQKAAMDAAKQAEDAANAAAGAAGAAGAPYGF